MSYLLFKLSMPNRASWNGAWSGQGNCYAIVRSVRPNISGRMLVAQLTKQRYFSHSWSDGWRACVEVCEIDAKEARKIRKASKGFCGYDWMVKNILSHGDCRDKEIAEAGQLTA